MELVITFVIVHPFVLFMFKGFKLSTYLFIGSENQLQSALTLGAALLCTISAAVSTSFQILKMLVFDHMA
jgi:Na+-translocating ferredoxin:NAD+ oxidoreductase RnfA subunit